MCGYAHNRKVSSELVVGYYIMGLSRYYIINPVGNILTLSLSGEFPILDLSGPISNTQL